MMLKTGFVGCGKHASLNIYPAFRMTDVDLVSVCDLKEDLARRNARNFGAPKWYTDYRKMLENEDLEALFVVIGPSQHYEIGKIAMQDYELHVFTEKPPSMTSEQSEELLRTSREIGTSYMVGFMKRFATANMLLKNTTQRQEFGSVIQYEARYTAQPYANEESFLLHHAVHHADLMRFFMGNPKSLIAKNSKGKTGFGYQILVEFETGGTGIITLNCLESWGSPNERVAIVGDQHLAVNDNGRFSWYRNVPIRGMMDEPDLDLEHDSIGWEQNLSWATLYSNRGYEREVDHFVKCVTSGSKPKPDAEDALWAMRIIESIKASAMTGEPTRF